MCMLKGGWCIGLKEKGVMCVRVGGVSKICEKGAE